MKEESRLQLVRKGIEPDPAKLNNIHAISAPSAYGKDAILAAVLSMAGGRIENKKRYTTRELRSGDQYQKTTYEQLLDWRAEHDLDLDGQIFSPYPGVHFAARLSELHLQLMNGPVASHYLPAVAVEMKAQGYKLIIHRLVIKNRKREQVPERVLKRAEQDAEFQCQIEEHREIFSGMDIINDFALSEPSGLVDADRQSIPLGAARAAFQWLVYITGVEKWDPSFLEPFKA